MQKSQVHSKLDLVATILIIGTCLVASWSFISQSHRGRPDKQVAVGLEKGQKLNLDKRIQLPAKRNILLALNTTCVYCRASIPFYRNLISRITVDHAAALSVSALFPNPERDVNAYLKTVDFSVVSYADISLASMRISGTPTILVVDHEGRLIDYWIGLIPDRGASALESRLADVTKASLKMPRTENGKVNGTNNRK